MNDDVEFIAPLFVPGHRSDRFTKAAASGADCVLIDLEDAVPPADKDLARRSVAAVGDLGVPFVVRVNAVGSPWHLDDLEMVKSVRAAAIMLPKVETSADIPVVEGAFGRLPVIGLVETPHGVENALEIVFSHRVARLAFGPADFFAEMEMEPSTAMTAGVIARLAVASRAAGLSKPLAGPCFIFGDSNEAILGECSSDLQHGAGGKLCIHPSQPALVLKFFRPTDQQVAWAHKILAASTQDGAVSVDGEMVDLPVAARAHAILRRHLAASHSSEGRT